MTDNNSRLFHTNDQTLKHLLEQLQKEPKTQRVAQAMMDMAHWDYNKAEPERTLVEIDYILRDTRNESYEDPVLKEKHKQRQETLDMKFKYEFTAWMDQTQTYQEALITVYNTIMSEYLTLRVKQLLEEDPEYETSLKGDPIATLKAINRIVHDGSQEGTYRCKTIYKTLSRLTSLEMFADESPHQWVERVKASTDATEQMLGPHFLANFLGNDQWYEDESDSGKAPRHS